MKVLFITDVPYWNPLRGSGRRIESLIDYLRKHHDVSVCLINEMPLSEWETAQRFFPVPLFGPGKPGFFGRTLSRLTPGARARPKDRLDRQSRVRPTDAESPVGLDAFYSDVIGQFVSQLVREKDFDVVVIEYVSLAYMAAFIRTANDRIRIAIDTHDVMHSRRSESTRLGIPVWLEVDAEMERKALDAADSIIAISPEDREAFKTLVPGKKVILASWAAETKWSSEPGTFSPETNRVSLGYIGSDSHANQLGLMRFLKESWPIIRQACEGRVVLKVAGPLQPQSTDEWRANQCAHVEWLGTVSDVMRFYSEIDIAINPAVLRSGFKIKSLEALSAGVPLVSTSAGLAGLSDAIGRGAWIADEPELFAQHVIRLVLDGSLRQRASQDAIAIVRSQFNPSAAYRELDSWIRDEA